MLEVTVVADSAAVEREAATAVEVQVADMEGSVDVERYD